MGEGTGSCPSGQCKLALIQHPPFMLTSFIKVILYLSTQIPSDSALPESPKSVLEPYLNQLSSTPLFETYYFSHTPSPCTTSIPGLVLLQAYTGSELLTEGLDWEAEQGETAFDAVMRDLPEVERKGFFEKVLEEGEEPDEDEL